MARPKKEVGGPRLCDNHWPADILNTDPHAIFIAMLIEDFLIMDQKFINCAIDNKNIEKAYKKFSPVCCYLGDRKMQEIYNQAADIHHYSEYL